MTMTALRTTCLGIALMWLCMPGFGEMNQAAGVGIQYSTATFKGVDGVRVGVHVFDLDPRSTRLEIIGSRRGTDESSAPAGAGADAGLGVAGVVRSLSMRGARYRSDKAVLVMAMGNIATLPSTPLGWLVVNGEELSPLDRRVAARGTPSSDAACRAKSEAVGGRRFSGVLCLSSDSAQGDDAIVLTKSLEQGPPRCRYAVQAGPVLVHPEDHSVGICDSEPTDYSNSGPAVRSAVCVDVNHRLKLALTDGKTHLLPFAQWLASKDGLQCRSALNLIGDYFASAMYRSGGASTFVRIGNTRIPQASMLVAVQR